MHADGVRFNGHRIGYFVSPEFWNTGYGSEMVLASCRHMPALLGVVVFDPIDHNLLTSLNAISWDGFLQRGRRTLSAQSQEILDREAALRPDDLATILYTSGTTGNPKGVMLTQENLVSNAEATLQLSPHKPDDIVLTWLPFSHIYARTVDHYQSLVAGVVLCLSESAESVAEDLSEIRPTHMSSVPRLYEKVLTALASPDKAQTRKKLREFFGEQIQWLSSGGAPLPRPITDAYQEAGLPLYQGYGLTETSPVITFNRPGRNKLGTVGQPIPGVEVRVASDGEVLSRGPHIMKGYWNNPPATAESIVDGWFHTGDLGRIDAEGYLSITGRKKELLVLSNGKKVVPSFIEGLLVGDECIDQAAIAGEGRNYLTALIVPHWENLRKLLATEQPVLASLDAKNLATHPVTERVLHRRIGAALSDVASWEQVKKFVVLVAPFTLAAEELTVSLKLRRSVVLAHYADELERLYKSP